MVKALPILDTLQQQFFFAAFVYIVTYPGWWLSPTPLKNMTLSVGVMKFPIEWKVIKMMFQTTKQIVYGRYNYGQRG